MKALTMPIAIIVVFCCSCFEVHPKQGGKQPPTHALWDELLQKHIDKDGFVDYEGFMVDRELLKKYLTGLEENAPHPAWSSADQLAYWINAYNAYTIALVLEHYPVESIKDIGSIIQVPFVNTPWDIKFIQINGEKFDLNNIEHGIIRKKFDEPRIHFALNCASISCPALRAEAYTGAKLEDQLRDQAQRFINDSSKNDINAQQAQLSKIFSWYGGDFKKQTSLIDYINQYSKVKITGNTKVKFMDYNWGLNTTKK